MSTFSMIDVGRTGASFSRFWLDTIAHNLANVNTVRESDADPFRAQMVFAQQVQGSPGTPGQGVAIREVVTNPDGPVQVYDPQHPMADEFGRVNMPVVNVTAEMTNLIIAQRSYQISMRVIDSGKEAYQTALSLGAR